MIEEWRPVPKGLPYEVSNLGRVRRTGKMRGAKVGRILAQWLNGHNYPHVTLYKNNKPHDFYIHTLVCTVFNGNAPKGKRQVRHLDGNRQNPIATNLKWGNAIEDRADMVRHGTKKPSKHRMLKESDIIAIRDLLSIGKTPKEIATIYTPTILR